MDIITYQFKFQISLHFMKDKTDLLFWRSRHNLQFSLLGFPQELLGCDLELSSGLVLDLGLLGDLTRP